MASTQACGACSPSSNLGSHPFYIGLAKNTFLYRPGQEHIVDLEKLMRDFAKKARGFTLEPTKTYRSQKKKRLGEAFKYYLIVIIIAGFLSGARLIYKTPLEGLGLAVLGVLASALFIWVGAAYLHIWVYALGGRRIEKTFKTVLYAATPAVYLWFGQLIVPEAPLLAMLVGAIGGIWQLVLTVLGLRVFYGFSTGRAVAVILLAMLPLLVTFLLLFTALLVSVPLDLGQIVLPEATI